MPRTARVLASDLSLADIRRLLAAKEKMVAFEEKKSKLESELAEVNVALGRLTAGAMPGAARGARAVRKVARKKVRKPGPRPARTAAGQGGAGKKARAGAKRTAKTPRKGARGKGGAGGTLQDVVAALIRENGKPMAFQAILGGITSRKLVRTRSGNFANVLRRTLSTSKRIKRVARATYGL